MLQLTVTMPIEMPRGLPFSVDTWSANSRRKRHHFLTHAHKDHSAGISTYASYPIYSTCITKSLVLIRYPKLDESLFVCIEVSESMVINDPDGAFKVTPYDANHCRGAVMYLFEGSFGKILHTGDCRLSSECIQHFPKNYIRKKGEIPSCRLDYVFLDCTFGRFPHELPSKRSAMKEVINFIWNHPNADKVYLACDLLGLEDILVNVSHAFGSPIFVDKVSNYECYQTLMCICPEIVTDDANSRFYMLNAFPRLYQRAASIQAEAEANRHPAPLIIRPSAQWYVHEEEEGEVKKPSNVRFDKPRKDEFGVWYVCYSIHSSRVELEWALELLAPKWVVSTTPSCKAVELDYVNKHCSISCKPGDPLWKLLDIFPDCGKDSGVCAETLMHSVSGEPCCAEVEASAAAHCLSPSKDSGVCAVTVFGNASHIVDKSLGSKRILSLTVEPPINLDTDQVTAVETEESDMEVSQCQESLSNDIRKLYRTMNVSVPRPLPSLMQLMETTKRFRR